MYIWICLSGIEFRSGRQCQFVWSTISTSGGVLSTISIDYCFDRPSWLAESCLSTVCYMSHVTAQSTQGFWDFTQFLLFSYSLIASNNFKKKSSNQTNNQTTSCWHFVTAEACSWSCLAPAPSDGRTWAKICNPRCDLLGLKCDPSKFVRIDFEILG